MHNENPRIYQLYKGSFIFFSVISYSSSKGKVIIKSGSSLPSLTTILPQGHQAEDYNITILVEIVDSLGAATSDTLVVKVEFDDVTGNCDCLYK